MGLGCGARYPAVSGRSPDLRQAGHRDLDAVPSQRDHGTMRGGTAVTATASSKVALVFPYFRTRAATEMLFPPLGVAALAAQLRGLGLTTRVFDGTFSTSRPSRDDVVAFGPEIVGISSMVGLTGNALRVAKAVRDRLPGALLVAGGPLPTVFPKRYIASRRRGVQGRGRPELPALLSRLLRGGGVAGDPRRAAARRLRRPVRRPRAAAGRQPDRAPRRERAGRFPLRRPQRLRPRRLPARMAATRPARRPRP